MTNKYCDYGLIPANGDKIYPGLTLAQARALVSMVPGSVAVGELRCVRSHLSSGEPRWFSRWVDLETGATVRET